MTTIELDVLLEFRDYVRANYWFLFRRFKLLFLVLLTGSVGYPLLTLIDKSSSNPNDNYLGALIPIGLLLLIIGSTYFSAKRQMASNKSLNERIHYTFSDNGVDSRALSSSGHIAWNNLYMAHETKTAFLLFLSRNMMYTIPKRCFHNDDDINSFRHMLQSKLSSKAKLK